MKWFLMSLALFAVVFIGRYVLYRLFTRWNWSWNGIYNSRLKSFACFYGRHNWQIERETYSCAKVCSVCQTPTNETQLERLEYERRLWRRQAYEDTTDFAKRRYVRTRLLEWDRERGLDGVVRVGDAAEAH
jgi:hypothetical protein